MFLLVPVLADPALAWLMRNGIHDTFLLIPLVHLLPHPRQDIGGAIGHDFRGGAGFGIFDGVVMLWLVGRPSSGSDWSRVMMLMRRRRRMGGRFVIGTPCHGIGVGKVL